MAKFIKKKYSLTERINYYSNVQDKEYEAGRLNSKKMEYSTGFLQGCMRGRPQYFDEKSLSYKKGCDAGMKARNKSANVRFY